MDNQLERDILRILNETADKIRANMQAKGVNASGRTSASIHTEQRGSSFVLVGGGYGAAPIPTLESGRRAGKVPAGFYQIIIQWTKDKGLPFPSETERNTFAYFVARKIARYGSERHRDPSKRLDIYSTAVTEAKAELQAVFAASARRTIAASLQGFGVKTLRGAFTQ